jgi:Histidine kinase-, DNA gyrase B-, and HSP90-like ATPase
LSSWLTRHGVERDWVIAPPLAAAGVDLAWCERAANVLEETALEAGLEWVASTLSVTTLLTEVKESTRRVSDLVAAVKSYSQMNRASMQHIDVSEGIESTLVMLGHKLRDGVTVVRDYDADVPLIDAYAGELNQVWTNLIDNAVDAMDGAGTLRVATRAEGDAVVVEISDTGPGMPPPVAARAFEAFFTTRRRQRHRSGPRHRTAHRRRTARWHYRHRLATGTNGPAGPPPCPVTRIDVRSAERHVDLRPGTAVLAVILRRRKAGQLCLRLCIHNRR